MSDEVAGTRISPLTWWSLALCLILAGTISHSLPVLCVLVLFAELARAFGRSVDGQSARTWQYLVVAGVILTLRVTMRLVFGEWPVAVSDVVAAATEGMRLVVVIFAVAMAAGLANPRKLLKATPAALYELATAVVIALNIAPQLGPSLTRVRKAAALRGRTKGLGIFASVVIPVLEDTMEQSLALAASMESRGFGARPERSRASRRRQRAASLAGLGALSFGSLELAMFGATWPSLVALAAGPILLVFAIRTASLGSKRTHLEPLRFGALDLAIVGGGLALVGASALLANATNGAWPL